MLPSPYIDILEMELENARQEGCLTGNDPMPQLYLDNGSGSTSKLLAAYLSSTRSNTSSAPPIIHKAGERMYGISYTSYGNALALFFIIEVLKIFQFEVMFLKKVIDIGPVSSCHFCCLTNIAFGELKKPDKVSLSKIFHRLVKGF